MMGCKVMSHTYCPYTHIHTVKWGMGVTAVSLSCVTIKHIPARINKLILHFIIRNLLNLISYSVYQVYRNKFRCIIYTIMRQLQLSQFKAKCSRCTNNMIHSKKKTTLKSKTVPLCFRMMQHPSSASERFTTEKLKIKPRMIKMMVGDGVRNIWFFHLFCHHH